MHINISKRTIIYSFLTIVFFALLITSRFLNLSQTARFTNDEASDLARIYQLGHQFKITLVGPISNDNSKVFGSLTYYLLLPSTILTNYSAVGPSVGMAFWSTISAVLLIYLAYLENKKLWMYVAVLSIVWYPLLETGRWGWNPHLVPLWILAGLVVYILAKKRSSIVLYAISGVLLGLSVHHHYVAIVAIFGFILSEILATRWTKSTARQLVIRFAALTSGVFLSLTPFIIFDLRHPPGLFVTRYLLGGATPNIASDVSSTYFQRLFATVVGNLEYLSGNSFLFWIVVPLLIALIVRDLQTKKGSLLRLIPAFLQIVVVSTLDTFATRYFLPALPFVVYWIVSPRKDVIGQNLSKALIVAMIVGSLLTAPALISHTRVQPAPEAVDKIVSQIREIMAESPTKDVNIAVLSSPDSAPLGESYRSVLGMHGVGLKQPSEYDTTSRLLVITTASESAVRADKSIAMLFFKEVPIYKEYKMDGTDWIVYWFQK